MNKKEYNEEFKKRLDNLTARSLKKGEIEKIIVGWAKDPSKMDDLEMAAVAIAYAADSIGDKKAAELAAEFGSVVTRFAVAMNSGEMKHILTVVDKLEKAGFTVAGIIKTPPPHNDLPSRN